MRCTHDHSSGTTKCATVVNLSCGCWDVYYADGTVCYEHAHVECDQCDEKPERPRMEAGEESELECPGTPHRGHTKEHTPCPLERPRIIRRRS